MNKAITATALIISYLVTSILYFNTFPYTYTPVEYPESAWYLDNPYMGFYHIYGYTLKDGVVYASPEDVPNIPTPEDRPEERLAQVQINLRAFQNRPLTDTALSQLDAILSAWSNTEYSLLLRFLYDWDGRGLASEPQDISIILQHMEQVAPIYNRYAAHILSLQGLFTGNYGEMNNTSYGTSESMRQLADKLAETADPSIYLAVRTPNQWRSITGADTYEELASMPDNPYLHRLGLYNDGMFGNESDTGTYTDLSREEEIAFQNELCRTVPNGGEVIIENPYNDLDNAIADMRQMHVSYLNSVYDPAVLNKWKTTPYTGSGPYEGAVGYDYIRDHMGYRYVLRSTEILPDYALMQSFLRIAIENVGFAESYRPFSFRLTLLDTETGDAIYIFPEEDSTCLASGETTVLEIPLEMETYPAGDYELYWQTMDDTFKEAIRYGNNLHLTEYGYLLGTLSVEDSVN